jgi:hypothetical protein
MQRYVAKHPFQGDIRQAQLSFPQGAMITAKVGQTGAWWWGMCNGKEGWFPPTYVQQAPQQPPQAGGFGQPPPQQQQNPNISMQQRMQQAQFAPSVQQQRPGYPQQLQQGYGMPQQLQQGYGMPQQQQRPVQGFQQQQQPAQGPAGFNTARPQPAYEPDDPFAGLDNMGGGGGLNSSATMGGDAPKLDSPAMSQSMGALPSFSATSSTTQRSQSPMMASTNALPSMGSTNMSGPMGGTAAPGTSTPAPSTSMQARPVTPQNAAPVGQAKTPPPATASTGTVKGRSMAALPTPASVKKTAKSPTRTPPRPSKSFSSVSSRDTTSPRTPPSRSKSGGGMAEMQEAAKETRVVPSAGTKEPTQLSPEELHALKEREKEEAEQKAQLRKEKEEMKKFQMVREESGGIGTSGIALSPTASGEIEAGLPSDLQGAGDGTTQYVSFNPFDYLCGTTGGKPQRKFSPIYRVPPFWALLNLQTYIRRTPLPPEKLNDRTAMYERLAKALSFVSHVCAESPSLKFLHHNHMACEACIKLISILPHSAGASGKNLDALFLNFINVFVPLIEKLQPNQQLVLPGGWQQPEYCNLMLYIVRNCGDSRWSFTVCNTSKDGLEYHPSSFDPESGRQLKQLAMTIWEIPSQRLLDSTFWILLFRMQVYPSRKNTAEFFYTKLLPALNSRPLLSNLDQGPAEYLEVPDAILASTMHPLARLALTTSPAIGQRSSKYSSLLLMNAALLMGYKEIENAPPHSLDPEDTRILKLSGRNLANFASTLDPTKVGDNTLLAGLSFTWELLDKFLKKINFTASRPMDQYSHGLSKAAMSDDFSKGKITSLKTAAGSAAHPLFGRLRRDDYENVVKRLMGDPRQDPILIPAVLTDDELPPVATDYATAASSLQRIADACSLLLQQRRLVKNSPAFAASASQYALTHVLPMPNSDPKYCFWRKSEMRRETQVNLLFLLRRIVRIYTAATACVQQSRGLVAIRSTALAAGACVADAICRVKCVDDPSAFCLHYSGLCEGPTEPFGIEAGSYDSLGSNLPIYDPVLCALRFRCLDYLRGLTLKDDGTKRNTIFNFDKTLTASDGDLVLINQLSIQLAFQRPHPPTEEAVANHATMLISGKNGSMLEVLPEFEYFRDIVFHFRHAVSGKAQTPGVPDTHTWLPADATLHWDVRRVEKDNPILEYHVKAFHGHHQDFVEVVAQEATIKYKKKGFLSLFSSKEREVRARLSSADPNTVINSCGEKFLNKRYVSFVAYSFFLLFSCLSSNAFLSAFRAKPVNVHTEDDILHLETKELPTFGHVLSPSDAERFVQFLTAPYIRIPLIMDFFANGDPTRLSALKTKSLQLIVDAALFEPGRWKPADYTDTITQIPVVDYDKLEELLATAHGTLFNEIAKSPDVITTCIVKMLERALDMDVGKYTRKASSGPLILYLVRLAVRIEGYMKYALKKCIPGQPRPRGLESLNNIKVETSLKKIRAMLDSQAIPTLEYWIDPSRCKDVDIMCLVHAHLLYLFKNYDYDDLDYRAVSVILSSQVYLTINHRFSTKVYDDLQDTNNPTHPPPSIQIAQSEIFDVIQAHRYNILRFCREKKEEGDHAMEAVVRVATGTGSRNEADMKKRHWQSIGHPTCYGRFVPDTEDVNLRDGTYRIPKPGQTYEEWMLYVTTKAVGIEVNLQLSDFTLQNHKMTLLDPHIMEDPDFAETKRSALRDASDVACAEVMHTTNRYWWRLVGRRYDIESWSPDSRNYYDIKGSMNSKHTRKFPNSLRPGERWISDTLADKLHLILPQTTLYMSPNDLSEEPFALLSGWIKNPDSQSSMSTHSK